jgi:CDP-glycerol glycerophosphotransferase
VGQALTVTLLSVVIPARDVAPYIERCLSSIMGADADVEVVVVDDASIDLTAFVARSLATADPRIRVITTPAPIGPGQARNLGLDEANGEYVWFVDGDDWLVDGAINTVTRRINVTSADVVLVDHVRGYSSGRMAPSSSKALLAHAPHDTFRLIEWLPAVDVIHTPWNKVTRRDLLLRTGVRFSSAPVYEDLTFTFGALRHADRIAVVPAACYVYRTARPGSIVATPGGAHMAWAGEWRSVLEAASGDPLPVRRALFERMVHHGWSVLGPRHGRRLPTSLHRRFFHEMVALHRAFRPPDTRPDPVLALGWWPIGEVRGFVDAAGWAAGRAWARLIGSS